MRKLLVLSLVIGLAALVGDFAGANPVDPGPSDGTATGVQYDWWGSQGEMSIVGTPGSAYFVFDAMGAPVADGVLDAPATSFPAGNSGIGPDGTVVFVLVGDDVLSVTDPDWEWN